MNLPTVQMFLSEAPNPSSLLSAGRHLWLPNSGVTERRDVSYGPLDRHKLDIYEPSEIDEDTELIVFIYGGGWETGSKDLHRFIGRSWARQGYITILPNYRLAPDSTYPDQVEDVARSLTWVQNSYENFPGSLYLAGHSAGAHLAALTGFSDKWRERAGLSPETISGYILLAGVYQFYPFEKADPRIRRFISKEKYWEEAQPFNHVDESLSPVFLAHGTNDAEVLPAQSVELRDRLSEFGVITELLQEEVVGHIELLLNTTREDVEFWDSLKTFFT